MADSMQHDSAVILNNPVPRESSSLAHHEALPLAGNSKVPFITPGVM